ncbi:MAG: DUF1992 domain-containing protein [Thiomonas sp.]|nr:DUF1992 domain-containing protein [Thiomonas sp.]
MNALAWIGEARIAQAVQDGKLDNLPGAGCPLDLTVRDGALDAQARLGLELLDRARRRLRTDAAQDQRERAALRLLWAKALARQRHNTGTSA